MDRRQIRRPQRVLIVEDSDDIRQMWTTWLRYWGFVIDEARDGAEAVRKARHQRPDLVLMDLCMPVQDGFSATSQLRSHPPTADVPVLAISALMDPPAGDRARAAGCDAFLAKPIDPQQLLAHIRAAFARLRRPG